jgi:hypothetical protein
MADEGIKKARIPFGEYPLVQFTTKLNNDRQEIDSLYYDFRYRIVSEDRNRFSHWSPIQSKVFPSLGSEDLPNYPYTDRMIITSTVSPSIVSATWSPPTEPADLSTTPLTFENAINRKTLYDIWIRWNLSKTTNPIAAGWTEWQYVRRESSNSFSTPKTVSGYQSIDIAIQLPTEIKLRDYNNNKVTLFRQISDTI